MPLEFTWSVDGGTVPPTEETATATAGSEFGATALRDKVIDPVTGELQQADGDQVYNFGLEGILSDLLARVQTFAQEVFLDTSLGLDYLGTLLTRFPDVAAFQAALTREILDTPGVVEVLEVATELVREERRASISFAARADTGDVISRTLQLNFTAGD